MNELGSARRKNSSVAFGRKPTTQSARPEHRLTIGLLVKATFSTAILAGGFCYGTYLMGVFWAGASSVFVVAIVILRLLNHLREDATRTLGVLSHLFAAISYQCEKLRSIIGRPSLEIDAVEQQPSRNHHRNRPIGQKRAASIIVAVLAFLLAAIRAVGDDGRKILVAEPQPLHNTHTVTQSLLQPEPTKLPQMPFLPNERTLLSKPQSSKIISHKVQRTIGPPLRLTPDNQFHSQFSSNITSLGAKTALRKKLPPFFLVPCIAVNVMAFGPDAAENCFEAATP